MTVAQLYPDTLIQSIHDGDEDVLADYDSLIFTSYEDRKLFVIHSGLLADDHELLAPVIDLARRAGLSVVSDVERENEEYPSGVERVHWFA